MGSLVLNLVVDGVSMLVLVHYTIYSLHLPTPSYVFIDPVGSAVQRDMQSSALLATRVCSASESLIFISGSLSRGR